MGIFDDAIRQHLEFKRQQGLDEAELKQLEDEAFGQAARPGDEATGEEAAVAPEEGGAGLFDAEAADEPELAEEVAPDAPSEAPGTGSGASAVAPDEPAADEEPDPTVAAPAAEVEAAEPDPEPTPVEPMPTAEEAFHPDEPIPSEISPPDPEPMSSFTTAEREAIADQPTVFFDQQDDALELGELDLDLEDELEEVDAAVEEPLTGEEDLALEPDPEAPEPPHEVEPEPEPAPAPQPEPEALETEVAEPPPPLGEEAAAEPGEDDVLEETPEFLRDNPDDDELWFEQGEPKDFDF